MSTKRKSAVKTAKVSAPAWEDSVFVYVGPSLKGAASGTIYKNGLPQVLEELKQEIPAAAGLIVPMSELSAAQNALNDPESAISSVYAYVEKSKED